MAKAPKAQKNKTRTPDGGAAGSGPDPVTSMVLAGIALRGGGRLLRQAVESTLGSKGAAPGKRRSVTQTLIGTTLVRVATRSVPGALVVGGGLLAKTLFDRRHGKRAAGAEAAAAVDKQAERTRPIRPVLDQARGLGD